MLILETKAPGLQEDSFSVNYSGENQLAIACGLWEEATDLLLQAGRILSQVKENAKREFKKLVEETGLERSQVNKLIKIAGVADEIPTVVARRLGTNILNQLGQAKNLQVLEAIEPSDTQILVAQKIKEHRPPSAATSREEVRLVGKKKGQEKLRIDIPGCPETRDIYEEFKKTGLTALEWLQNLRSKQPTLKEVLKEETNIGLSEPWKFFPQKWQHDGKDCYYEIVNGERILHWDNYQTKISDDLAAKYINPRTFLDFELIAPGAKVTIDAQSSGEDKSWNTLPGYVQSIKNDKVRVCLQGDYREKTFNLSSLKIVEPSPIGWSLNDAK